MKSCDNGLDNPGAKSQCQAKYLFSKREEATRLQKVRGFMGLFSLRVQRLISCSMRAEKVWTSVPNPLRPMIMLSCILKTRWKSLVSVSICLPNRRSAAIPTQSLPTMPTIVPPLYSKMLIIQNLFKLSKEKSNTPSHHFQLVRALCSRKEEGQSKAKSCIIICITAMESVRQKVTLMDNLPKVAANKQIAQLRAIYEDDNDAKEKIEKYIPIEKQEKYEKNFTLFDRNNDGLLDLDELREFLISIGQMISEDDLKDFYKQLARKRNVTDNLYEEGITLNDVFLIVLKRMREQDVEEQLSEAFRIISEHKETDKDSGYLESDFLKELLMTMGYKWGEDQADEFIKEFQPKSEKRIYPSEVVKKMKPKAS